MYLVYVLILLSCNPSNKSYQTKFVSGSTNNKIEILDFGGPGEPILFLAGLGNSAHIFVDFAPKFSNKFHVYAMTRRGFRVSEQPAIGYKIDTLSMDILAVTKALKLDKVILIGHSIAGDEISKFASSYPEKVSKVVYLDGGHDRSNLVTNVLSYSPTFPSPNTKDSSSFYNYKEFMTKTIGVNIPDEEIQNIAIFSNEGKFQKDVTPGEIKGKIISGVERPNYRSITCPALSIYAIVNSVYTIFPFYDSLDVKNKLKADNCLTIFNNYTEEQIALFKKEVKNGIVKEIKGAHHYVFISNPNETEKLIMEFLTQ